ncbi:MAG: hypothetical protein P8Y53_09405 [Pseudolabrys sp.]
MATDTAPRQPDSPRMFDMRALWRPTGWGVGAALALAALAVTTQTHTGSERLKLAFAPPEAPAAVAKLPPPRRAEDAEMARLQTQVRMLTADRERMTERIASLEHSLDDLTGSIKRQLETARAESKSPPPAVAAPRVTASAPSPPAAPKPAQQTAGQPAAAAKPEPAKPAAADKAAPTETAAPAEESGADQAKATPAEESSTQASAASAKLAAAPPQAPARQTPVQVVVPMPPERVAALAPKGRKSEKPQFGLSVAGASSRMLLRMQWAAAEARFGSLLGDLKPYALAERRNNVLHYRLIIGPMPTYTAAARLCGRLIAAHAVCHPVKMAGEPL